MPNAYLLHTRPYRDRSVLCDWFTAEGRLVAILTKPSKKRAPLQPFQPFWLDYMPGRGEFVRIKKVEAQGAAWPLVDTALFCGLYLNELILLTVQPMEPQEELMQAYEQALASLASKSIEPTLRNFEYRLLSLCGYALPFELVDPDLHYRFDEQLGFVATPPTEHAFSGCTLQAISEQGWGDRSVMRDAKRLFRQAIDVAVGHRLIKTRQMMQSLSEYV